MEQLLSTESPDLELILIDPNQTITMRVHKRILIDSCKYFEKAFAFNNPSDSFTMEVPHARIVYDTIQSFYGTDAVPNWRYIFDTIECRDYLGLGLDIDVSQLYGLKVPPEAFDQLLKILSLDCFDLATNRRLVRTVKHNLPENFDMASLSPEFADLLIKKDLVVSCNANKIKIWDIDTGIVINNLSTNHSTVRSVAISSDNKMVAFAGSSSQNYITIWDPVENKILHELSTGCSKDTIYSLSFSSDNRLLLAGGWKSGITIWNPRSGNIIRIFKLDEEYQGVLSAKFSPNDKFIVSGHNEGLVNIWDVNTGQLLRNINAEIPLKNNKWKPSSIYTLSFSNNGEIIAFGGDDRCVTICSLCVQEQDNGTTILEEKIIDTIPLYEKVLSIAFSPDDKHMAVGTRNGKLHIYEIGHMFLENYDKLKMLPKANQCISTINAHRQRINTIAYACGDEYIVAACDDASITVWNACSGDLVRRLADDNWNGWYTDLTSVRDIAVSR